MKLVKFAQVRPIRYSREVWESATIGQLPSSGGRILVGDGEWLTVSEAAERLKVSTETVRRAEVAGKLVVGRTPGGHRRISRASVDALYREMYPGDTTGPTPEE